MLVSAAADASGQRDPCVSYMADNFWGADHGLPISAQSHLGHARLPSVSDILGGYH